MRKKKHCGEFRELGYQLEFAIAQTPDDRSGDEVVYAFIDGPVQRNGLYFGGGWRDGIVDGVLTLLRGSVSPGALDEIVVWLKAHKRVQVVRVSSPFDVWYDELPFDRGTSRAAVEYREEADGILAVATSHSGTACTTWRRRGRR